MNSDLEKPKITEIKVRIDCNGCVQKIKKALHGINGIYDLYIDFPQQKLTIIGWADPEKIVKAIRKTRKIATIYSHKEQQTETNTEQTEQAPETSQQTGPESANPPQTEPKPTGQPAEVAAPPPEAAVPQVEPQKDQPPPENPSQESSTPAASENNATNPSGQKDVGEVHVIYHYPPDYGYGYGYGHSNNKHWERFSNGQGLTHELPNRYANTQGFPHEPPNRYGNTPGFPYEPPERYAYSPRFTHEPPVRYGHSQGFSHDTPVRYANREGYDTQEPSQPVYVTHSYNTYRPSPYVTEYQYTHSPPRHMSYSRRDNYREAYHNSNNNNNGDGNGNITAMFSDENPNACAVM